MYLDRVRSAGNVPAAAAAAADADADADAAFKFVAPWRGRGPHAGGDEDGGVPLLPEPAVGPGPGPSWQSLTREGHRPYTDTASVMTRAPQGCCG
jgi:hypothetical protein